MLYIPQGKEVRLYVPNNGREIVGDVSFKLWSTTDRATKFAAEVKPRAVGQYWLFEVDTSEVEGGEYEYRLVDEVGFLASGVAKVVESVVQYNEFEQIKTYTQYGQ